jgi:glycosyltransferase involved in cell wall biosynthesis
MNQNSSNLRVLMLSTDRQIFTPGSRAEERMKEYGSLVEELHIVVLADAAHSLKDTQLSPNTWVYSTNSRVKFLRPIDGARIGKKIILNQKFVRGRSVITAQDPFECGWAALSVKNKWRLPLEVQLHTDPFSPYFKGFLNILRKGIASRVLHNADTVRVVSLAVAKKLAGATHAPVNVLPIYVKQAIQEAPISFDLHARFGWKFVLLCVARLVPEKNLDLALESLALVKRKYPDTGLVIVGDGPEKKKLKSAVKKLGLNGFVEFPGWQNEMGSFYKTANVFIQTSYFEGYGLAFVEAGLCGLPVITTQVGVAQEFSDGKELYFIPQNAPGVLADKIIELLENNQKRENLKFNLKNSLTEKLISKEEYLKQLVGNWEISARKIS